MALRVVPKHRLKFSISSLPFDEFLESYEEIVKNSEHAAFIYFPYVDHVRVEVAKKLNDEEELSLENLKTSSIYRFYPQRLGSVIKILRS